MQKHGIQNKTQSKNTENRIPLTQRHTQSAGKGGIINEQVNTLKRRRYKGGVTNKNKTKQIHKYSKT